jgi:release factor glutamine methyltransferase
MPYDLKQIYAPEADTFLLRDAALAEVKASDRVLEIGTGTGLVAAALEGRCEIVATDINPHAVRAAREKGVEVVRCDLAAGIRGQFDLILFNPPYLPTQPGERIDDWLEYSLDGGGTGRATIERFAADVSRVIAPHGRILLIISSLTGTREIFEFFRHHGFMAEIVRRQPVEDEELYVLRIVAGP